MVILGTAHGKEVAGKRMLLLDEFDTEYYHNHSCTELIDGKYYFAEWKSSRLLANRIKELLDNDEEYQYKTEIDWMGDNEIGLRQRVDKVKDILNQYKDGTKAFYLSLHHNAIGFGNRWYDGKGISGWTLPQYDNADKYLKIILDNVKRDVPNVSLTGENVNGGAQIGRFKVLWQSIPAILMETLFFTNKEDLKLLYDETFREQIANSYAKSIKEIHKNYID